MKKSVLLALIFTAFSFLQACNDTSIDPIQGEGPVDRAIVKERLERTAWVVVNESDNLPETSIGVVIRYFPDGTLWESSEGDETTWRLTQDGKSIIMENYPEPTTYKITKTTDNELKIELSRNGQTYWI
ncbi:MAG TPA: hypothetical protein VEC36_10645, partial [Patescibacteria group bacterium]|nr:hypothetical protein [Patescibacteria group bacterium]